jgi:1-acyl-sn-glycerol-3-phosphate acyltransferase
MGAEVRRDASWEPPWINKTIYSFWQLLGRFVVFPFLFRVNVAGVDRVPDEGAIIVASNHFTNFDPILTGSYIRRYLTFMAKRELVESLLVGWLCRQWGVLPVSRDGMDLAAVRQMLRILRSGQAMVMYPEGTRSRDGRLHEPQPGAAYAAMKLGAPVIPVSIWGTEAFSWRRRLTKGRMPVKLRIGHPLDLGRRPGRIPDDELHEAGEKIMRAIAASLPPSYRGPYG